MSDLQVDSIGQYIVQRRNALHITQKDLSDRLKALGTSRDATTISNWESERHPVPLELIEPLSHALEEPSPAALYELAGILDQIPGGRIVKRLRNAPPEFIDRVERMIDAFLSNDH